VSPDPWVADQVPAACAATLAAVKVPRTVYRVAPMPYSALNKIDKKELRMVA
jgi:non-ribosomal peptide synthetase component E (peptide arylation enzyme)